MLSPPDGDGLGLQETELSWLAVGCPLDELFVLFIGIGEQSIEELPQLHASFSCREVGKAAEVVANAIHDCIQKCTHIKVMLFFYTKPVCLNQWAGLCGKFDLLCGILTFLGASSSSTLSDLIVLGEAAVSRTASSSFTIKVWASSVLPSLPLGEEAGVSSRDDCLMYWYSTSELFPFGELLLCSSSS